MKQLSDKEIKKIKYKNRMSIVVSFVMLCIFVVFFYLANQGFVPDIKRDGEYDFSMIMFDVFWGFFILLIFSSFIGHIININNVTKDSSNKTKVKIQVKVIKKIEFYDDDDFSSTTFRLIFEDNDYITCYDVSEKVFNKVNEEDIIDVELGKNSKYVTKIEWNNKNIENTHYLG